MYLTNKSGDDLLKIVLTSCFWDFNLVNGREVPSLLIRRNGLSDAFRSVWTENARVLIISSDPEDTEGNDFVCSLMKESFLMSGLGISHIDICDKRNPGVLDDLGDIDVLVFAGGHVPTQNRFMKEIGLRERLSGYRGNVVALSAGSMNCADLVYAIPELDGEAIDPTYERWITGLGLTDINIFPHYQYLKDVYLDGFCMSSGLAFADSMGKEIIALNDGSYILIADGHSTVYGEAYMIKDGEEKPLCADGELFILR